MDAYVEVSRDTEFLKECLTALKKQIRWFKAKRAVPGGGFYYLDIYAKPFESGMDEGVRFLERRSPPVACVDATAHVYVMYDTAARWSKATRQSHTAWERKAKTFGFEGKWPVVAGSATPKQAKRMIDNHLLSPNEFSATHPITTVALSDSAFEMRMWRSATGGTMGTAAWRTLHADWPMALTMTTRPMPSVRERLNEVRTTLERSCVLWMFTRFARRWR